MRLTRAQLLEAGARAPLIVGSAAGASVPLGAFAGVRDLSPAALESPAVVVDTFSRRRSETVLLVDNVDLLDGASLYVVTQLISSTQIPAVLTVRDLDSAPQDIHDLYDSGYLTELELSALSEAEARLLISSLIGGIPTPRAEVEILAAAGTNPLHLREIIRGTLDNGGLIETPHGWEINGPPAPSQRLTGLVAERFSHLPTTTIEAATLIALTGECPSAAISTDDRNALAHADLIESTDCGWLRLSRPLDAHYLISHASSALRHEVVHRAIRVLSGPAAETRPHAQRQATLLALDHGCDFAPHSMMALAEYALGSFDAPLALRAATAVLEHEPDHLPALITGGLAASLLDRTSTADSHFDRAKRIAHTDAEKTSVALAYAQHVGIRHSDAKTALQTVQDALASVHDEASIAHLQGASVRWAAVAGQAHDTITTQRESRGHEGAMSLITAGVSGVVSGPLQQTTTLLPRLRQVPDEFLALVPGGDTLIELTEIMALSYSGDVLATRRRLRQAITSAQDSNPESLGAWEYALGFLEFFSADAERAYNIGQSAASHLAWRDGTGLLPAARALTAAAALATGRSIEARKGLDSIPDAAASDPKVVMLRSWVEAWQANAERRADQSADLLLDTANWLMSTQHTYFGGMIAHCVARMGRRPFESAALLRSASTIAGGGLLQLFTSHADAVANSDFERLAQVAADASELGLVTTAADTRLWLSAVDERRKVSAMAARRHLLAADEMRVAMPTMALWNAQPDRSTLLTEREHRVARLAADRYSSKEIAEINDVSVNTVTNQLNAAFRKLGVSSRAELRDLFRA
ncbi:helix-turn-helix transcriptional regulator [Serinibacter salmoneus]|nr:helix-turn-helix transcriptional regulator [Serinibacter salmoneus]